MATNEHIIKAPGMMKNLAVGGHLTTADQVLDDAMNKEQSQINAEIATAITNEVSRAEAAEELLRQAYEALTQSTPVPVTELPENGEEGVIYRLAGDTSYSDYMWNGEEFVKMAEYDNATDDVPTAGSNNLVKSNGPFIKTSNAVGDLRGYVEGHNISRSFTSIHGYYNLTQQRYYPDVNYCCIIDVSALKGCTVDIISSSIPTQNAFFVDYNNTSCVMVGSKFTEYPAVIPENANYLYCYLGTTNPTYLPRFYIVDGDYGGKIGRYTSDVISAIMRPIHGVYSIANNRWDYFNHDKEKYTHIVIPVKGGDSIKLSKGINSIFGIYLRTYRDYSDANLVYNEEGFGSVYTPEILAGTNGNPINHETYYEGTAPEDAKYLVLLVDYSSTNHRYLPKEIYINDRLYDTKAIIDDTPILGSSCSVRSGGVYDFATNRIYDVSKALYSPYNHGIILSSNQKWVFRNYNKEQITHILLPIKGGDAIKIIKGPKNIVGAFLKDYYIPSDIEYDDTGYARIDASDLLCGSDYTFNQNTDFIGTAPSTAKYLFIWSRFQDGASSVLDYTPASVFINGVNTSINAYAVGSSGGEGASGGRVGIQKISDTEFNLLKNYDEETLIYYWYKNHWQSQYNGIDVVDEDSWANNKISTSHSSAYFAQAAINFIHMFANATYHTGNGHGCTVDKVFDIFVDGQRVDFDNLENYSVINGDHIHIIQQSDGYYPDTQRTIENGGDGNKVYAQVDANGIPVLAVRWCLDYHFTADGERYINKLFICDDNVSFKRCYGAMNTIYPAANPHHISINDYEATYNSVTRVDNAWIVTAENGINLSTNASDVVNATKVVQYGDSFRVETECINDNNPTFCKLITVFDTTTIGGRIKIYQQPIKTTAMYGANADVFNTGDVISCHVIRNVSIHRNNE